MNSLSHLPTLDLDKHVDPSIVRTDSFVDSNALEKRVWRKLDWWILPIVTMFSLLSFLDRANFGNARVAGMRKDLNMTDRQYSIALTVTYIPYIAAELPSNLLLKIVGPNLMLPTMLTLCGMVATLQGVVSNYQGLLACRFFLGLFEGGMFPGLVLYLSLFYPRQQLQWRISALYSSTSISGAFSGLLAFEIINMDGIGGRPGWAWMFILEGLFTVVFGAISYAFLPRSPAHARFFSAEEKEYVQARLREDGAIGRDEAVDSFSWREVGMAFKLPQVQMLTLIFFSNGCAVHALAYFTPSIVEGLGYTAARAQLMSVPPLAAAFGLVMVLAYISDRYHCRGFVAMFSSFLGVIGFGMFLGSKKRSVQYGSLFFSIPGQYVAPPTFATWNANNTAPHARHATAIAIGFIMTNSGGILATWLLGYLSPPPRYMEATTVLLALSVLMTVISGMNTYYLWEQNKKKAAIRAKMSREEEEPGLGDKSAWFVYNL